MDWDEAAGYAVEWLEATRTRDHGTPILVTPVKQDYFGVESIQWCRSHYEWTTVQSRGHVGPGPVLAYVPYARDLEYAMRLARGRPICVVEANLFPLAGWAQELGAVNLLAPDRQPESLPETAQKELESLTFYGNNAWGDSFGKNRARQILPRLRQFGILDDTFDGRMIARGAGENGVKNLRKIIDRL